MTFPIDFVIDWVDDSDPRWINKRNAYLPESERLSTRFRDWGWLKYCLDLLMLMRHGFGMYI